MKRGWLIFSCAACLCLSGCAAGSGGGDKPALPQPESTPSRTQGTSAAQLVPERLSKNESGVPMLRVYDVKGETLETLSVEDYLPAVLAGEMAGDWPLEALKAQAILARTFVLQFVSQKESMYDGADISTDIKEAQAYDAAGVNARIREAVKETRGEVLNAGGELPYAWFHAHSGGLTARAKEGLEQNKGWFELPGEAHPASTQTEICENGVYYHVDFENGQKTGFFLDQKYNRRAVARLAAGHTVLDCFTHTGSFALNAASGGAARVTAADISADAIAMAQRNAERNGLTNMDFLTVYAGGLKTPESGLTRSLSIRVKDFPYIIFVNKDGNRFVDELGNEDGSSYDEITSWWKVGDNKVYIMLDQAMVDDLKAQEKPIITGDKDWANFDDQLAKGNILFSGSTIEEVAEKAGINAENLAATIEKYNTYAKNGLDEEFGRTRLMKEFTGGTYYIFETTPYIMITAGGPAMTDKGEVVDADGNPIPGLYQAGEIVGMANAFGRTTIGGVGNTGSLVWGALAGGSAAAYALGK